MSSAARVSNEDDNKKRVADTEANRAVTRGAGADQDAQRVRTT